MVEIIDRIFEIMKANLPRDKAIQEYIIGRPDYKDVKRDPYMYAYKTSTNHTEYRTGGKTVAVSLDIVVGVKRTKELGPQQKKGEHAMYRKLYELVETSDFSESQASLSTDCVTGVLSKFITLRGGTRDTQNEITTDIRIDEVRYDAVETNGQYYLEATVSVTAFMVLLVSRQ